MDRFSIETLKFFAEMKIQIEKQEKKILKRGKRRDKQYYLSNQKEILQKNKIHAKTPEAGEIRREWKRQLVKKPGMKAKLCAEAKKRYAQYKKDPNFIARQNELKLKLYHAKKNSPGFLKNRNKLRRIRYAEQKAKGGQR